MGGRFCKELDDYELHKHNNNSDNNTKITHNNESEICVYKYPISLHCNYRRPINIFYIDYDIKYNLVYIKDYIHEYLHYNKIEKNSNILVKIFIKWYSDTPYEDILDKSNIITSNIASFFQIPCIAINIYGTHDNIVPSKILFHIVEDEFNYRILRGVILSSDDSDNYSHHISRRFIVVNLNNVYKKKLDNELNFIHHPSGKLALPKIEESLGECNE